MFCEHAVFDVSTQKSSDDKKCYGEAVILHRISALFSLEITVYADNGLVS